MPKYFTIILGIYLIIFSQSFAASYNGPVKKISGKHEIFFKCFDEIYYTAFTAKPSKGAMAAEVTCEPLGEDLELNMFLKSVEFPNPTEDSNIGLYVILDKFGNVKHLDAMAKVKGEWVKGREQDFESLGFESVEDYDNLVKGVTMIVKEVLSLVHYKKKKSYKNKSVVVSVNFKQLLIDGLNLELYRGNVTKSQFNQWKNNISNAEIPKLNLKLSGETVHDGRPAYLLKLNKKTQNAHFKGYMLIDKETGFALIYNATYKLGNETIPGIYVSSFESDEEVRGKIQRIDVEKTDYKVSKKILETKKKNEPKVYISDEERAKRINDFVQKYLSHL